MARPSRKSGRREPGPFSNEDRLAGEVYKNIKIFGRLPAARLGRVMPVIKAGLGVECSHCHVEGDWASDEKEPKQIARNMFGLRGAISQKYFEGKGGPACWTCHRGSAQPEIRPAK